MRAVAAASALLLLVFIVVGAGVADARRNPVDLQTFMAGLACTESGGRFEAINSRSGAIGKYQIMPRNWVAWSGRYMGNRWAPPTPRNQEFVARSRIVDLYEKHGDWRLVAHWWLTGNAPVSELEWSRGATNYVRKVMGVAQMAASPTFSVAVPERCFPSEFADPTIRDEPFPRAHVRGGRVNVRLAPGYENRAFDVVRRGDVVPILKRDTDPRGKPWLKVGLEGGQTGWIAAWFTRVPQPAR